MTDAMLSHYQKVLRERDEINYWVSYLQENQFPVYCVKVVEQLKDSLRKVVQWETAEMGYQEGEFLVEFVNEYQYLDPKINDRPYAWYSRPVQGGKPAVTFNLAQALSALDEENVEGRLSSLWFLFYAVFHELQHARQYLMMQTNVSSRENLTYAREFLILSEAYDWYTDNHENFLIENNADETAYRQTRDLQQSLAMTLEQRINYTHGQAVNAVYQGDMTTRDGYVFLNPNTPNRDDFLVPILDNLICVMGRTYLLTEFPILQKEYNLDGTKKDVVTLIQNMQEESQMLAAQPGLTEPEIAQLQKDSRAMYYELIYRELVKIVPEQTEAIAQQVGTAELTGLLQRMSNYFAEQLATQTQHSALATAAEIQLGNDHIWQVISKWWDHGKRYLKNKHYLGHKEQMLSRLAAQLNATENTRHQ